MSCIMQTVRLQRLGPFLVEDRGGCLVIGGSHYLLVVVRVMM